MRKGAFFNPDYAVSGYCIIWVNINHKAVRYTKQGMPLRRNCVCPAFNPPDIQYLLCVLCVFVVQKREEVNEVNNVPEIPIYRGNAETLPLG